MAETCSRCRRPVPAVLYVSDASPDDPAWDDPDLISWEVVADENGTITGYICGGCMTQEEHIEIVEADMEWAREMLVDRLRTIAREIEDENPSDKGAERFREMAVAVARLPKSHPRTSELLEHFDKVDLQLLQADLDRWNEETNT